MLFPDAGKGAEVPVGTAAFARGDHHVDVLVRVGRRAGDARGTEGDGGDRRTALQEFPP